MAIHKGKSIGAHRAAWIKKNGKIPDGLVVCHKCDVTLCVNTEHMFLGTLSDNMQDCKRKGRMKFFKNQSGKNNANARPDYEDLRVAVKADRLSGMTYREIRQKHGIKSNGHLRALLLS